MNGEIATQTLASTGRDSRGEHQIDHNEWYWFCRTRGMYPKELPDGSGNRISCILCDSTQTYDATGSVVLKCNEQLHDLYYDWLENTEDQDRLTASVSQELQPVFKRIECHRQLHLPSDYKRR